MTKENSLMERSEGLISDISVFIAEVYCSQRTRPCWKEIDYWMKPYISDLKVTLGKTRSVERCIVKEGGLL